MHVSQGNCCGCGSCNPNPCQTKCRTQITSADLADLIYIEGLDVNLCKKYQLADEIGQLVDCSGTVVAPGTPIVTCANHQSELCAILGLLPVSGNISPGTTLVGSDCQLYVVPNLQNPITVQDTVTVDLTLSGDVLSADVIVSPDLGNIIEVHPNGLYGNICNGISNLPQGPIGVPGFSRYIGFDCEVHNLPFNVPLTVVDTLTVDLTGSGVDNHTLQADVIISSQLGNELVVLPDGLFVPPDAPETPITVIDTVTVDLTVSGVNNHTLQADVNVSGFPNNDLIINPDGLYVSVCDSLGNIVGPPSPIVPGVTPLVGANCQLYTVPVSQSPIAVLDTVTVDMTLTGGNVISSDVNVSGVVGNILSVLADGLYVPTPSVQDVIITGLDSSCIDITVNEAPANNFTVSASPILNPAVDNTLSCTPQGLYVPASANPVTCAAIQGLFTDSGSRVVAGDQVLVDNCTTKIFPTIQGVTSSCIGTQVILDGINNLQVNSFPIVSNQSVNGYLAGCNGTQCTPSGFWSPPDSDGNANSIGTSAPWFTGSLVNGQVVVSSTLTMNITNPSSCRQAVLVAYIRLPGATQGPTPLGPNEVVIQTFRDINFPSLVTGLVPVNLMSFRNVDPDAVPGGFLSGGSLSFPFIIQPGESGTVSTLVTIQQTVGASDFVQVGPQVIRYWLYTI